MKKPLLYTYLNPSSFVLKDIEILEEEFDLSLHRFDVRSKYKLPFAFLKQIFFLIRNTRKQEVVIVQFAGYQSALPVLWARLFRKKSILVLGGTDCVYLPSINYGNFSKGFLAKCTSYSLKKATLLLPVSQTLVETDYDYQSDDFKKQGYKAFVKGDTAAYKVIHNGFKIDQWQPAEKEKNSFVTVAADLQTRFGIKLKGIDLILEIAPSLPDCQFYIVGGKNTTLETPSNVHLIETMPNNELPHFIATKEYYLQLSMSEGFPNALCEAMLCGCIPIVSAVGAMPEIVTDKGFILFKKDTNTLLNLIRSAKSMENHAMMAAESRDRIVTSYSFEKRKTTLLGVVHQLFLD